MALHLNAEQKNLRRLWSEYDTFVIPPYQRPYSWDVAECRQLYDDLIDAFNRTSDRDYFMGTIILAVADDQRDECPRIVDGQQRMTTFWLMFKSLSVLLPDVPSILDMLYSRQWDGLGMQMRIKSLVNDANDMDIMTNIYSWGIDDYEKRYKNLMEAMLDNVHFKIEDFISDDENKMRGTTMYFYYRFREFKENDIEGLRNFAKFLMQSVLIIPIEMHAPGIRDAEDKALVIFETINNRGVELSNSDIFKARLYSKAITTKDKDEFVKLWDSVVDNCKRLGIDIDRLFTIYKNLSLAEEGNHSYHVGIREFFDGRNGEISRHSYSDIMNKLLHIADIFQKYKSLELGTSKIAGWAQMLSVCNSSSTWSDSILAMWVMKKGWDEKTLEPFMQRMVKYTLLTGQFFGEMSAHEIMSDIAKTGDSKQLHVNGEIASYLVHYERSCEYAKLALILEMGGGLLDYEMSNIVQRKRMSYYTEKGECVREKYFDESLGNIAFVPTDKARQSIDFERYMQELERVDPECAAVANKTGQKYLLLNVNERSKRKAAVLDDFFKRSK